MVSHPFKELAVRWTREQLRALPPSAREVLPAFVRANRGTWSGWSDDGCVAVFFLNDRARRESQRFRQRGLAEFPDLLTSDPNKPASIDVSGAHGYFAFNRFEVPAFRVRPTGSFAIFRHTQVFRDSGSRQSRYTVDLAFVVGVALSSTPEAFRSRLADLIDRTVEKWTTLAGVD